MTTRTASPRGIALILGILVTLGACGGGRLRSPICEEGEIDFPEEYAGWYRITIQQQNPALSNLMSFDEMLIFLRPTTRGEHILVPEKLQKFARKGAATLDGTTPFNIWSSAVCPIGNLYFAQDKNSDGTYSLARLDFSSSSITRSLLAFDPAELQ